MNRVTNLKAAPYETEVKTAPIEQSPMGSGPVPETIIKKDSGPTHVKMVSKKELNKRMQAGEAIQIVNVLDPSKYSLGFIKGSKRIPLDELDARVAELDKSKPVVTYCSSRECNSSKKAALKLSAKGFNVSAYEGGIKEWKESGLPTEI